LDGSPQLSLSIPLYPAPILLQTKRLQILSNTFVPSHLKNTPIHPERRVGREGHPGHKNCPVMGSGSFRANSARYQIVEGK